MAEAARNLSEHDSITDALRLAMFGRAQGQHADAERLYSAILEAVPDHFDALHLLGQLKQQRGQPEEALALITHALTVDPRSADAWTSHGLVLHGAGRHEEALASFDRALALAPDHAAAFSHRGNTLRSLGRHDEAIMSFDCALAIAPGNLDALNSRAKALISAGRPREALASCDRALAARPEEFDALVNRGIALAGLERHDEAIASYDRAIAQRPYHYGVVFHRAKALGEIGRLEEALAGYDRVLKLQPFHAAALNARGLVLYALGRDAEALAAFREVATVDSDQPQARFNESRVLLRMGEYDRGWRLYEARWDLPPRRRAFKEPLWLGNAPLEGKTILLHAEQGPADTIQLVRYVPMMAAAGAKVVLEVQAPLVPLLQRMDRVAAVIAEGAPLPPADLHCPLMSLPFAFKTTLETIPAEVPYLAPDPALVATWRQRLPAKRLVGLAWSGNRHGAERPLTLARLAPLLDLTGLAFVNLQGEMSDEDRRIAEQAGMVLQEGLDGFADLAAATACLDLVIAADNPVAHLAGALGKPVWLLLTLAADFRWLQDREDSPWYPTARLFREPAFGDQDGLIARVREALAAWGAKPS